MSSAIVTPYELTEFLKLLKAWGAPEHLLSLDLHMEAGAPVEMTCRFYASTPEGKPVVIDDAFAEEARRYRLVAIDDDEGST